VLLLIVSVPSLKMPPPSAVPAALTALFALMVLSLIVSVPARQRARELAATPAFAHAQRQRKKVEALFAELKNQIGLRRLRLRRMKFVREQFCLAAAAQHIKRLVRFLSKVPSPNVAATA